MKRVCTQSKIIRRLMAASLVLLAFLVGPADGNWQSHGAALKGVKGAVLHLGFHEDKERSSSISLGVATVLQTIPTAITQIVLVTTPSWNSSSGTLERLEYHSSQWVLVGRAIPVVLGSNGLAWGRGLQRPIASAPQKIEGDHRAPAGIFGIGPAFGYSHTPPPDTSLPYLAITGRDYFIDDINSDNYNTWVTIADGKPNEPTERWNSFEVMRRPDNLYQLGVVIQQNINPVVKGRGSAIFFHVWSGPKSATAGCTAMALDDLLILVTWLDKSQSPVLIQAPTTHITETKFSKSP